MRAQVKELAEGVQLATVAATVTPTRASSTFITVQYHEQVEPETNSI